MDETSRLKKKMLSAHRWSSCPYLPAEHIVENLSCVFPSLEVDSVEVPEEEEEEARVVHLLAELGQDHVALLLVVAREQHRRYVPKLLAHLKQIICCINLQMGHSGPIRDEYKANYITSSCAFSSFLGSPPFSKVFRLSRRAFTTSVGDLEDFPNSGNIVDV